MGRYWYKAASPAGEVSTGSLEGASVAEVVARLQAQGQVPIRVEERGRPAARGRPRLSLQRHRVKDAELAAFTREMATLLEAGLPLDRALGVLGSLSDNPALISLVDDIRRRVQHGEALGAALAAHPRVFPPVYVNLVRAGESGGALETVLGRLAEHLERSRELRESVTSALIYPVILVLVAVGAVLLLLAYVVPQFAQLFADVDRQLPLATRVVVGAGELLQNHGVALLAGVLALAALFQRLARRPGPRRRLQALALRMPLAGEFLRRADTARFARTLSTLLGNGVPLLEAFRGAGDVVEMLPLAERLGAVAERLREGGRLADELARAQALPAFAVQMIRVGEESGDLPSMLERVADVYERELQTSLRRALAVLEPALILVLGVVVAGIVMSILVAILGVNQLAF